LYLFLAAPVTVALADITLMPPPLEAESPEEASLLWLLPPRSCSEEQEEAVLLVATALTHSVTSWATSERWLVSPSMYREPPPLELEDEEEENRPLRRLKPASLLSS
jgi:hypothetical protein